MVEVRRYETQNKQDMWGIWGIWIKDKKKHHKKRESTSRKVKEKESRQVKSKKVGEEDEGFAKRDT